MACSAVKIETAPNDLHEECAPPTLKCCARAALKSEIIWVTDAVTKRTGATFLCNVSVPVLGSLTRPLGDRRLLCAISLPDESADCL